MESAQIQSVDMHACFLCLDSRLNIDSDLLRLLHWSIRVSNFTSERNRSAQIPSVDMHACFCVWILDWMILIQIWCNHLMIWAVDWSYSGTPSITKELPSLRRNEIFTTCVAFFHLLYLPKISKYAINVPHTHTHVHAHTHSSVKFLYNCRYKFFAAVHICWWEGCWQSLVSYQLNQFCSFPPPQL